MLKNTQFMASLGLFQAQQKGNAEKNVRIAYCRASVLLYKFSYNRRRKGYSKVFKSNRFKMYEDILTKLIINLWNLLPYGITEVKNVAGFRKSGHFYVQSGVTSLHQRAQRAFIEDIKSNTSGHKAATDSGGLGGNAFSWQVFLSRSLQGSLELLPCFGYSQGKMRLAASASWHHRSACFICAPTIALIFIYLFLGSSVLLAQVLFAITGKACLAILCMLLLRKEKQL